MPRDVPAEAGAFRITIRIPGPPEAWDQFRLDLDEWLGGMAASEYAQGLPAMPSVHVARTGETYAELVLEWVGEPADGPWAAVERVIEDVVRVAFPDLLTIPDEISVTVSREWGVGRDVVLDDETLESAAEEAERRLHWPPTD